MPHISYHNRWGARPSWGASWRGTLCRGRVSAVGGAAEIAWEAEADFESGIGGFAILRDGQELVKLPEKPPANAYGRRLFQEMSYHDTPEPPVAEMRYIDQSSKPGEKHTYAVVTINSAGLRSKAATQ